MLKRAEAVALSKGALQRVASGRAGTIPAGKKHIERLAKLKQAKKERKVAETAHQSLKRA